MIRKLSLVLLFLLIGLSVFGQDSDLGIWYGAAAKKSAGKKFDITGEMVVRTFDKASLIEQAYFELGGNYSFSKYLDAGLSYRITNYAEDDKYYHLRHKWFADLKGTLPAGRFDLSLRMRFQVMRKAWTEDETDDKTLTDGRIRFKAEYNTRSFPLNPYVSFETFLPMFRSSEKTIGKSRSSAGFEMKLSKKHLLDVAYIYEADYLPDLSVMHIISLGYTVRF